MRSYHYDSQKRIFTCPDHVAFPYSDGEAMEERLLSVIRHATDVSTSSLELVDAIEDWPSEYHLSPARHNLLRFLQLGPTHRILELGCGCGAITRFLGETGAAVVAVEGSARRAQIAAERCRGLDNVNIYCDNLAHFQPGGKFDCVTLIGVLEYAPKFIHSENPVEDCLRMAHSFLKEDGFLALAIENQLGLKYFNGSAEDHLGIPYFGIHDLYGRTDPTTFGRHVLAQKLSNAGFHPGRFFYPFPDYKLPQIIVSETALGQPGFQLADLLSRTVARDRSSQARRTFHEQLAWRAIVRNNLMRDLANSFLVLAARNERCVVGTDAPWLARTYTSERRPHYATETVIRNSDEGMRVMKRLLHPRSASPEAPVLKGVLSHRPPTEERYIPGRLYIGELQSALERDPGIESVALWARDWLALLSRSAQLESGEPMLDGEWLDAIPTNYIRNQQGELEQIDREWAISCAIPLAWVVIRGLVNSITACQSSALSHLTYRQAIVQLLTLADHGIKLTARDFAIADQWESALRAVVFCTKHSPHVIAELLDRPAAGALGDMMLQDELHLHKNEIQRIKATVSWQVTKPLRLLANLPRLLREALSRRKDADRGP